MAKKQREYNFSPEFKEKQSILDERKKTLKKNITPSELRIKILLKELKINTKFQKGFIAGKNFCIVDFYIPKHALVLEVDGGYHNNIEQIKRDKNRDFYLSVQRNVNVIHITNEIANTITAEKLYDIINIPIKKKGNAVVKYFN